MEPINPEGIPSTMNEIVDISKIIEEVVMDRREIEIVQNLTQQLEAVQSVQPTTITTTVVDTATTVVDTATTVGEEAVEEQSTNAGNYLVTKSFDELKEAIEEYSEQTNSIFVVSRRAKDFGSPPVECDLSKRSVMWEEIDGPSTFRHEIMHYNGTPFMVIGTYILQCQFGNDQSFSKKERRRKLKETGELVVSRSRTLSTPTKKCGCPASITAKQIIKFPEFYLETRTEYRKKSLNRKLKDAWKDDRYSVKTEVYYVVKLPDVGEHKFHELLGDSLYAKEPVLKELKFMIQEMTMEFKTSLDILNTVYSHVENHMFHNKQPPDRTRRKYFPHDKDVRNISHRVREYCRFTEEDEEAIGELVNRLEEQQCNILFRLQEPTMEEALTLSKSVDTSPKRKKLRKKITNAFVLVFQTPSQALLLKKYGGDVVYIVEVTPNATATRALTFRTYLVFVQTNVDFQLVGCFMSSKQKLTGCVDCLSALKSWNPSWTPKYFMVELNEQVIQAITSLFPESDYYLHPESCEKKWLEFLHSPPNELVTCVEEVMKFLREVQKSHTQEALSEAASEMEKSDVWNSSAKLREWFQLEWLANAKRWVMEYRPHDLLVFHYGYDVMAECVKKIQVMISDSTKSSGQGAFISMIEKLATSVLQEQYDSYVKRNRDYYMQCVRGSRAYPHYDINYGIPLSMVPNLLNVKNQLKTNSYNIEAHEGYGVFKVSEIQYVDGTEAIQQEVLAIFGDHNTYPSCMCLEWFRTRRPCAHMFAIFQALPHWKYDALSPAYRMNSCLNFDFSCLDASCIGNSFQVDKSCQSTKIVIVDDACTQKDTADIFHTQENLSPVSESLLINLKEFSRQTEEMERIFSDKECYKQIHTNLTKLAHDVERRLHWSQNSTLLSADTNTAAAKKLQDNLQGSFVSMKSFVLNNTNSQLGSKSPRPLISQTASPGNVTRTVSVGLKSGICKRPVVSKIVSNETEFACVLTTLKKSPLKNVANHTLNTAAIKNITDDKTLSGYRSKLRSDRNTNNKAEDTSSSSQEIVGQGTAAIPLGKRNVKIIREPKTPDSVTKCKRKLTVPVDVANAVNILTNSAICTKKAKTCEHEKSNGES